MQEITPALADALVNLFEQPDCPASPLAAFLASGYTTLRSADDSRSGTRVAQVLRRGPSEQKDDSADLPSLLLRRRNLLSQWVLSQWNTYSQSGG